METWSYYTLVIKNSTIHTLDDRLNALGAEGWELATSLTTVKTWVNLTGNDLVLVFKKRGTNERPSAKIFSHIDGDPEYLGY